MEQFRALAPRVSVVIVNLNGRRYLDGCLEAVVSQEIDGGHEVILVDNGSTDDSVKHVREKWPEVCVLEAGRNMGFAGGNNLGITQARGRHVVLLNNDTRVRPGWLAALVCAAEADRSIGAVTSKLLFMERPNVIQNVGSLLLSDGSAGDRGSGELDTGQYETRDEVFGACGCAMLLKRAVLTDVGALDATFFCYYEDTDFSWRMRLRGWRVMYEPTAVVEHVHSGTSVEWSPFFTFHVDRNRLFMILKNAPARVVVRSFTGFAWLSISAVARAVLMKRHRGSASSNSVTQRPSSGRRALIHASVLCSLLAHLPEMLRKRVSIRRGRRVSDDEVMRWLHSRRQWDERSA